MTRSSIALATVVATLAIGVAGVPAAGAATHTSPASSATSTVLYKLPVTGVAKNGKRFSGTYAIQGFVVRGGKAYSSGMLTGRLKGRRVARGNVRMPVSLTGPTGAKTAQAATCTVLHLVLGPVNLNLLGLRVTLGGGLQANQPIVLDITAQQGGGLLGDLLCGLTNLLNTNGLLSQLNGNLQQLTATLNSLVSLLGGLQATQP
jgi:hypothetical protein